MKTTDDNGLHDLERRLIEARISPVPDPEHKNSLRAHLRARARNRRTARAYVVAAAAVVILSATLIDQGALQSTGMRLESAEIVDGNTATFATREDAKSAFGFSRRGEGGALAPIARGELDSLRTNLEELQKAYLEGRLPLTTVSGLTFRGRTEFNLGYGGEHGGFPYPVKIGEVEDSEEIREFFLSARYSELWRAAYRGSLGTATLDTLLLNGTAVAMASWRVEEPDLGVIELHLGTPLN